MNISFYQVMNSTPAAADNALSSLLEKVIADKNNKVVIKCSSVERMERVNESLWNYKDDGFLPHGSSQDTSPELQPIYITEQDENPNSANILVLLSGTDTPEASYQGESSGISSNTTTVAVDIPVTTDQTTANSKYDKILHIFEASDVQKQSARAKWKILKEQGHELAYFAHEDGRWTKKA